MAAEVADHVWSLAAIAALLDRTNRLIHMQWEFAYVDLWLGEDQVIQVVGESEAEIARLGREGWEPVGEITFQFTRPRASNKVNVRQLMFKRPISEATAGSRSN
jgi:hypothetical protein